MSWYHIRSRECASSPPPRVPLRGKGGVRGAGRASGAEWLRARLMHCQQACVSPEGERRRIAIEPDNRSTPAWLRARKQR